MIRMDDEIMDGQKSCLCGGSEWRSISNPPDKNGYVLLALTHHNVPAVLMGFCRRRGVEAHFSEETYYGSGVIITHWAEVPLHPWQIRKMTNQEPT